MPGCCRACRFFYAATVGEGCKYGQPYCRHAEGPAITSLGCLNFDAAPPPATPHCGDPDCTVCKGKP